MPEQVAIGVIGTSWWAENALMAMFAGCERAKLMAVCARTRERADEVAARYGVPQVFTDYRQMIEHGKLDAVVVATPDDTHYAMVMAALDAGLHVLCEKPIALNAKDAKAMYDKAEAAHLKHMVMYTWHWLPPIQHLKQIVDEGRIGKIYHGDIQWQTPFWRKGDYHWRVDAERANGILGDLGSHVIHLALWTMGDVASVSAQLGYNVKREGMDGKPFQVANDSALITLEFVNGAQAQLGVSAAAHLIGVGMKPTCTLYGEKGTVEGGWQFSDGINQIYPYLKAGFDNSEEKINEDLALELVNYFKIHPAGQQFIDAILDDKPIYPGLYEGYKVQQVIDAALEAHRTGCRVAITS